MPTTQSHSLPVLLLKTKSSPIDRYEEVFNHVPNIKYAVDFIPVLEHSFQQNALADIRRLILQNSFLGPSRSYGGLIFTSQRAVEAFSTLIQELMPTTGVAAVDWFSKELPIYTVGPATARGLRALPLRLPILGEWTGNGDKLANFILKDYNQRWTSMHPDFPQTKPPLLFLVGEQRRDVIPVKLSSLILPAEERIVVKEMMVYEARELAEFRSSFLSSCSANRAASIPFQWVVVFSPTGCRAMLESLGYVKPQKTAGVAGDAIRPDDVSADIKTYVATIGPTTCDYMQSEYGFRPHAVAEDPSPEGLERAIQLFMDQLQSSDR